MRCSFAIMYRKLAICNIGTFFTLVTFYSLAIKKHLNALLRTILAFTNQIFLLFWRIFVLIVNINWVYSELLLLFQLDNKFFK